MIFKIYTDGSCHGNPGPGGWAFIIVANDEVVKEKVRFHGKNHK